MYIKANIDDCAIIINDFLPNDLFKAITSLNLKADQDSYNTWHKDLYKDKDNSITMKSVNHTKPIAYITEGKIETDIQILNDFCKILISCPFIPFKKKSSINITQFEYDKFSGINWHNDDGYTINYSFYMHDTWNDNWGGETLIDTNRGLPLVSYPYPNTLLTIKNNIQHKVCPVTGPKKRKVLQIRGIFYE
tara:strand:- start:983 stop:1558 length:576 start_codon:yes stop_codon:yes gene_type:complete